MEKRHLLEEGQRHRALKEFTNLQHEWHVGLGFVYPYSCGGFWPS